MRTVTSLVGFLFDAVEDARCVVIPRMPFKPRFFVWSHAADVARLERVLVGGVLHCDPVPIAMFASPIGARTDADRDHVDRLLLELAELARESPPLTDHRRVCPRPAHLDAALSLEPWHPGRLVELAIRWPAGVVPRRVACLAIGWGLR